MPFKDKRKTAESQHRWYLKNKGYSKAWKLAHPESVQATKRKYHEKISSWMKEYKKNLSCSMCGENHPACIQFHHRVSSEKNFGIGERKAEKCINTIKNEIEKCDVLCANCHFKIHAEERARNGDD